MMVMFVLPILAILLLVVLTLMIHVMITMYVPKIGVTANKVVNIVNTLLMMITHVLLIHVTLKMDLYMNPLIVMITTNVL
jgi:hypothetical protein